MIQSHCIRNCILKDHQEYEIGHICTIVDCEKTTRWCCRECLSLGVHNHQKQDNSHIMNRQEILENIMKKQDNIQKDYQYYKYAQANLFKKIIKECQQIQKSLFIYKNQYKIVELNVQQIIANLEQCLSYIKDNNFQLLDNYQINQILKIYQYKFDKQNYQQQLFQPLNKIQQQLETIGVFINQYQNNCQEKSTHPIRLLIKRIENMLLEKQIKQIISIMDLKYPYGGSESELKIYDIELNKIVKEIKVDDPIMVCQFNQDTSQLFVGSQEGYVYGYDLKNDFSEFFKQQIHSSSIYNIIIIKNEYLLTCSADESIIKTDIKIQQQILKLTGHTGSIISIDYNQKDDIIVSGSKDKSIKLWNCKNKSIVIDKNQLHNAMIIQIQLINLNLNILSSDQDGNLYKWKIDLQKKDLIKLQQFNDYHQIFNFYLANQDSNLVLICNDYMKILNSLGETIYTIEHDEENEFPKDCKQLDNLKYIQIRAENKILLAIAQD